MPTYNVLEAKTNLSRLIEAVENGSEAEIIIARNGTPRADRREAGRQQASWASSGAVSRDVARRVQFDRRGNSQALLR